MPDPIHADCFLPGTDTTGVPLVLLHGSGGNECALMPLASELAPKAAKLGIRDSVAIADGYAFVHRFPDRRLDQADIEAKASVLAEFIETSRARYNFGRRPMSIGFSNGRQPCCWPILADRRGRSCSARSPAPPGQYAGADRRH
jgi:phospholipase/carboxylesterase